MCGSRGEDASHPESGCDERRARDHNRSKKHRGEQQENTLQGASASQNDDRHNERREEYWNRDKPRGEAEKWNK